MRILAVLKPLAGKAPSDFAPLVIDEEVALWALYRNGVVREMHFDDATLTASLLFEAATKSDVEAALRSLPMIQADLFTIDLIEQKAWTPIEAVFRPGILQKDSAIDVVRGIYEAVSRADWDSVLARLDTQVVFEQSSALPFAGVWKGHDGFKKLGEAIFRAWPDFTVEPVSFCEAGDVVLVVTRVRGAKPRAGAGLDQTMIEYWKIENQRAVECRPFYFDPVLAAQSAV
jgi:hypothetical protein